MIKPGAYFIAGTDTEVGKTFVSTMLLRAAARADWQTQAFKPVAAGATYNVQTQCWENDDALSLQAASSTDMPYAQINPVSLPLACSPHIAAAAEKCVIEATAVAQQLKAARVPEAQFVLVEGAGGWYAPISDTETMADIAVHLGYPVILVVGLRLGCLNHAVLTQQAIQAAGCSMAGWIGCQVDARMPHLAENIRWLRNALTAPCLAVVPWQKNTAAEVADLSHLFFEEVQA